MNKLNLLSKLTLLLAVLLTGAGTMWAQSDYSKTYTSNVTLTTSGGTGAAACKVKINDIDYDGIKAGTNSKSGAVQIIVPKGAKYLHLHLAGWNGESVTLSVSPNGYSDNISLASNSGISGSSMTYTFSGSAFSTDYYKTITFSDALVSETKLTFTVISGKRFVVWGVNSESDDYAVEAPTFSPVSGAVEAGTVVNISSRTDGATVYYTTDGSTPSKSSTQGNTVTINESVTIKAFAVKEGLNDSPVSTAEYTIKEVVHGYNIDFEHPIEDYVDWTITNIEQGSTTISAHTGNDYGNTGGMGTASITTKEKVAYPNTFTCYLSKHTNNKTSCSWIIQVSSDGAIWTPVKTQDATTMSAGSWIEFTADLKQYTDVYVRLFYGTNTAVRAVDDISLTTYIPSADVTLAASGYASYCSQLPLDLTPTDNYAAWAVTGVDGTAVTFTKIEGAVPAETPFILYGKDFGGNTATLPVATGETTAVTGNMLKGTLAPTDVTTEMEVDRVACTLFGLSSGSFVKINSGTIPANKAYLPIPTADVPSGARLAIVFADETTGIAETVQAAQRPDTTVYDLQGRKVSSLQGNAKGLYIVNGKKVLVK